jgi:hypothetical protein
MRRALLLVWLLASPLSRGHGPAGLDEEPVEVPNPKVSWAYVGEFVDGDEVFEVVLDYPDEGFALPIEMLVPHQRALEDHRPAYAVVGPGLPPPTEEERALLPRAVPEGMGVFVERNDVAARRVIFEGVLRRVYWSSGPVALALDRGSSEIWIWSPEQSTGSFTLGLGVEEDFGGDSVSDLLAHWSDYAY